MRKKDMQRSVFAPEYVSASLTVEASMVMIILLTAVFFIMTKSFSLYDGVMERIALTMALEAYEPPEETETRASGTGLSADPYCVSILSARMKKDEKEIMLKKEPQKITGSLGDLREEKSTVRPEDVIRQGTAAENRLKEGAR